MTSRPHMSNWPVTHFPRFSSIFPGVSEQCQESALAELLMHEGPEETLPFAILRGETPQFV